MARPTSLKRSEKQDSNILNLSNETKSNPSGHTSRDCHQWTPESGLKPGIPSLGIIQPQSKVTATSSLQEIIYDVAVIGAGYAGLTATRDLTLTNHKTVLIEARDRIGGRSWSSNIDGYAFEMGGTWVHRTQPFIWRELFRYDLLGANLEVSPASSGSKTDCAVQLVKGDAKIMMSREDEVCISEGAMIKFINVDGQCGRTVIPRPMDDALGNKEAVAFYDKMSIGDRLAEIAHQLSPIEKNMLKGFLSITCGGKWADSSFFEMLRWWALSNWNHRDFFEMGLTYKLKCGQSGLQRCLFDEANATGNLDYSFSTPVARVADHGWFVEVTGRGGETLKAKRLISYIPLNVLHTVVFYPLLNPLETEVSVQGHANHVVKCHVEVSRPEFRTLGAFDYPDGKLTYAFGDGTTPAGNTHLVAFGSSLTPEVHLQPEENIEETLAAWKSLLPADTKAEELKRVVFHNWHKYEFAQGAWEWFTPGQVTKYLEALREKHGNVYFGSADWATGWRGFLDGGIEDSQRTRSKRRRMCVTRAGIWKVSTSSSSKSERKAARARSRYISVAW